MKILIEDRDTDTKVIYFPNSIPAMTAIRYYRDDMESLLKYMSELDPVTASTVKIFDIEELDFEISDVRAIGQLKRDIMHMIDMEKLMKFASTEDINADLPFGIQ